MLSLAFPLGAVENREYEAADVRVNWTGSGGPRHSDPELWSCVRSGRTRGSAAELLIGRWYKELVERATALGQGNSSSFQSGVPSRTWEESLLAREASVV